METQTSLVRTNCAIELNTIAEVSLNLAVIVNPRYAESEDAVGLYHTLNDLCLLKFGMLVINLLDRLQYLAYCLQILALAWMLALEIRHYIIYIHIV